MRVGCGEDFKAIALGCVEEFAVLERRPTEFVGRHDLMCRERSSQPYGPTLDEEDAHSGRCHGTSARMLRDGADLNQRHDREPLHELGNLRPILQVFERGLDRDSYTAKYPCTVDAVEVTLDGRTC